MTKKECILTKQKGTRPLRQANRLAQLIQITIAHLNYLNLNSLPPFDLLDKEGKG